MSLVLVLGVLNVVIETSPQVNKGGREGGREKRRKEVKEGRREGGKEEEGERISVSQPIILISSFPSSLLSTFGTGHLGPARLYHQ